MKLSELNTNELLDTLVIIAPPLNNIVADNEILDVFKAEDLKTLSNKDVLTLGLNRINKLIPILLKKHREDVLTVLGALNNKSAEEMGKMNGLKTILEIKKLAKDEDLINFLSSCVDTEASE